MRDEPCYDDLAIGAPGEGVGAGDENGLVAVLYGSKDGLTAEGDVVFHRNTRAQQ